MLTQRDVRAYLGTDLPVRRLLVGDEFETWAVGEERIAKFPRAEEDAAKVPVEVAVHPTLRRVLGDVVPPIHEVGEMREPGFRFMVFERARGVQGQTVEGDTITAADGLARHVGELLGALHGVDAQTAEGIGMGERPLVFDPPELADATMRSVTEIVGEGVLRFLESAPPRPSARRTLCHTDIKGEHVFVDPGRRTVTAIIDWADAEVCDPAKDYAGLVIWLGASFTRAAVAASAEQDDTLAERSIWLGRAGVLRYFEGLLEGTERGPLPLIRRQLEIAFSE